MWGSVSRRRVRYSWANSRAVFSPERIDFRMVLIWEVGGEEEEEEDRVPAAAASVLL